MLLPLPLLLPLPVVAVCVRGLLLLGPYLNEYPLCSPDHIARVASSSARASLTAAATTAGYGLFAKDLANEVLLLVARARGHSGEFGAPEWCCGRALRRKISCEERLASRS